MVTLLSCELSDEQTTTTTLSGNFTVENNILSFESSNDLKAVVDALKDKKSNKSITIRLNEAYNSGFLPLHPCTNDEILLKKIVEKRSLKKSNSHTSRITEVDGELYDIEDDLIVDDDFASFLSVNRQIIVDDTLYTYTPKGIYTTHKQNLDEMDDFILDNNIEEYVSLPPPGKYETTNQRILLVIPDNGPCGSLSYDPVYNVFMAFDQHSNECYAGSYGGGPGSSSQSVDHTESLRNYAKTLTACNSSNNFMGIFGPDRRCWSYFDSRRRTKTVFWKSNYLIYRSVGVKVKHQKRHRLGWWYASDDNDEIALLIDKAYFKMKPTINPVNIHNQPLEKIILFDGKVYNNQAQLIGGTTSLNFQLPNLPLNAQFTISDFINNNTGISITPNQIRDIVYTQFWDQMVNILQSTFGQSQPKTLNYYLYDTSQNEIHFMHINVEERRAHVKKIVRTFDFNMGIGKI